MVFENDTYYIWLGGSCDYAHKERAGAGACVIELNGKFVDEYVRSSFDTTEFRMMLEVMIHTMEDLPEGSSIVYLSNVSYLQNFDRTPDDKSANPDLIGRCIELKSRHSRVEVRIVPYHKYKPLPYTHELSHKAMNELRRK